MWTGSSRGTALGRKWRTFCPLEALGVALALERLLAVPGLPPSRAPADQPAVDLPHADPRLPLAPKRTTRASGHLHWPRSGRLKWPREPARSAHAAGWSSAG
jgi:hypothetical protein